MSYKYDVFFSYRRNKLTESWHEKLVEQLKFWLNNEIAERDISIFYDKESIEVGDLWANKIGDALKHSRCIVAVLSPDYFKSEWCYAEISTFLKRQEVLSIPGGIIMGARFHDGNSYPGAVKNIQQVDFNKYASLSKSFWETRRADDFTEEIKKFAKEIALKIKTAPSFQDDFPIVYPSEVNVQKASIKKII